MSRLSPRSQSRTVSPSLPEMCEEQTYNQHAQRLAQALQRIEQLESDLSFLARHVVLSRSGHATVREHERVAEIVERYPRWVVLDELEQEGEVR